MLWIGSVQIFVYVVKPLVVFAKLNKFLKAALVFAKDDPRHEAPGNPAETRRGALAQTGKKLLRVVVVEVLEADKCIGAQLVRIFVFLASLSVDLAHSICVQAVLYHVSPLLKSGVFCLRVFSVFRKAVNQLCPLEEDANI